MDRYCKGHCNSIGDFRTLFFLLSGYTMKPHQLDVAYLRKKFVGLMKPYFITVFFVMIADVVNTLFYIKDSTIQAVSSVVRNDIIRGFAASGDIKKILTVEVESRIGAVWFLPAMFFAIIFAQLVIQKCYKCRYVVSIVLMVLAQATGEQFWLPFSIQSAMMAVLFVVLGYDCSQKNLLNKLTRWHYIVAGVAFSLGVWLRYGCYFVVAQMTDLGISSLVGLCGCVLIYLLSNKLQNNRVLQFIGQNSIVFLCCHLFGMETMRGYFDLICAFLEPVYGAQWNTIVRISLELLFILITSCCAIKIIQRMKELKREKSISPVQQSRMIEMDIEKAILIVLMLIGYFEIDGTLRNIIYSFHMAAFIMLSGYFYTKKSIYTQLKNDFLNLIFPCFAFIAGCQLLNMLHGNAALKDWKDILLAMSFSGKLFLDAASIGPVWFVFMLFCAKQLYGFIQQLCSKYLDAVVILLVLIGIALGNNGFWLPWSFDCALYGVGFYHIGYKLKEYGVLKKVSERPYFYFALSSLWAYAVFKGSAEIAIRKYIPYTIACVGAICATIVLYMLSEYIKSSLIPACVKNTLVEIGQSTIWILLVHTLLENEWLSPIMQKFFSPQRIYYMAIAIVLDIVIGVLFGKLWNAVKSRKFQTVKC